ncbi:MAG: protein O-mannosyl-transferase family [Bacteroidota bacterium]
MRTLLENKITALCAGTVWILSMAVYFMTLSPSVGFIDSGELAAVGTTLGIAHPTGYPLFTVIARFWSMLPVAGEEIVRLNIMSAFFTSGAMVLFFFVMLELLEPKSRNRTPMQSVSSATASLFLALSQTVWRQGITTEVYSLHLLLLTAAVLFFLIALRTDENRWWIFFSFVLGLSFTNHMTTMLLAPAVMFLYFRRCGIVREAFVRAMYLALPFAAGLSVYLFLPVRASSHPLFNWGNPQTAETFLSHVSGKQFQVWMFSSTETARTQLEYFFDRLPAEFFYLPLIAALIGIVVLFVADREKFFFVALLAVTCVAYAINYDIHDIDAYFLLAYVAVMIFAGFGMNKIFQSFSAGRLRFVPYLLSVGLVSIQAYGNWKSVDQSRNYYVEDYTTAILRHLPPNAIILSYQWDYFISASYYYQHVRSIRPDVRVLDKELFRRSWYFPQLERMYPEIMERSRTESILFLQELMKFEKGLPYEYGAIEGRYANLLKSIIDKNIGEVSIFVTPEIEQQYTAGYRRIPYGLVSQLTTDTVYRESPFPEISMRSQAADDRYTTQVRKFSSMALRQRGMYEQYYRNDTLARRYFELSQKLAE